MLAPRQSLRLYANTLARRYRNTSPLTTLWHLYDEQHLNLGLAVLFFICKMSPVWLWPILLANIINTLSQGMPGEGSLGVFWVNGALLFALILQNVPTHTLYSSFISKALRHMQLLLRSALVTRLQQLSIAFHGEFHSGKVQTKVLRDVESIEGLSRQLIEVILQGLVGVTVALAVTLYYQPVLALCYLFTVPAAVLLMRGFYKYLRRGNEEFRREFESMSARMSEMIEMIPVTRAHGAEEVEIQKMEEQLTRIKHKGERLDVVNAFFVSSAWASSQLFQLLCVFVCVHLAYNGNIKVGDVVMYQGFFTTILNSVNMALNVYPQLCQGVESIRSLGEILECPDLERNEGKRGLSDVQGRISFENVEFRYGADREPAVRNFALDVVPGECVAFVGESGSGKSTLMNLAIGFIRPSKGRILLDGVDMETLDLRQYRQHLAVVSQNTLLFSGSIRENITYGLREISEENLQRVLELANVAEFVNKLPDGLNTRLGEHGNKLSGGQRQRIAIARALIRDPQVIILDEATSALDVLSESLVQEAIEHLMKGRTTFIVAHRLSTIRKAGRIVVMKGGECVETGSHDELMAKQQEFFLLKSLQT